MLRPLTPPSMMEAAVIGLGLNSLVAKEPTICPNFNTNLRKIKDKPQKIFVLAWPNRLEAFPGSL